MTENQEVFFHVGLGKVASTYLQKNIFPRLKGISYISTHQYKKSKLIIPKLKDQKVLVSREFDRQFEEEVRWFTNDYPNARIIILFRRHDDWIASQYKRHVKNGFFKPFREFIDINADQGFWKQRELVYADKLKIIEDCCQYPPLILCYDDLVANPQRFVRNLTDYLEIPPMTDVPTEKVHKSFSEKQLKVLRAFCRRFVGIVPANHQNKMKHWLLYRPVWALYHLILYVAYFFPVSRVQDDPLIELDELQMIQERFENDWILIRNQAKY